MLWNGGWGVNDWMVFVEIVHFFIRLLVKKKIWVGRSFSDGGGRRLVYGQALPRDGVLAGPDDVRGGLLSSTLGHSQF
jgi:hypothetical protein